MGLSTEEIELVREVLAGCGVLIALYIYFNFISKM
jgi:hypothetical protein